MKLYKLYIIIFFVFCNLIYSQKILIPMDNDQNDHLKAYGIAFSTLEKNKNVVINAPGERKLIFLTSIVPK